MKAFYAAYLAVLGLVAATIAITPLLALHGPKEAASLLYNAYVPTCHQWIYRSSCVFFDGKNHRIGDCIEDGVEAEIATEFTVASKKWDGEFRYYRDQIGYNRAERVQYAISGEVGYKFPNDTRNIGIYLFMLLAGIVLPFKWKNPVMPRFIVFVAGILPLAIDGGGQMLGLWESTNLVRFVTGALTGVTLSVVVYALVYEKR